MNDDYEYTDEDMAAVGRAFMAAIEQNRDDSYIKHWSPAQCPSEIIVDLINHHYDDTTVLRAQLATARRALEEDAKKFEQIARDYDGLKLPLSAKEARQFASCARDAALNSGEQK